MLRIGICDDDKNAVEQLHNMLVRVLFSYTDVEIHSFADGEEVIKAIREKSFFVDLLFLDVHMKQIDGMKTAEFIRKHKIDVDIIFLSVSGEYVFKGYQYKAFAYYLKPVKEEFLKEELLRYIEERKICSECLTITTKKKEIHLPLEKVIYFKSEKRKIIAHMLTGREEFYSKLDAVENLVGNKEFMRCHQSYMVNRSMIDSIGRTEIIVQGISIPMSRKYYENMESEEELTTLRITHSLAINQTGKGAIVFTKGKLLGAIIHIQSNQEIKLGRDGTRADIVINDTVISRLHCGITYNSETKDYFVCDYSKNGLYRENGEKLPNDMRVRLKSGDELCLGDNRNIIQLG